MEIVAGLKKLLEQGGAHVVAAIALVAVMVLYRSLSKLQGEILQLATAQTEALTSVGYVLQQVKEVVEKDQEAKTSMIRAATFAETVDRKMDKFDKGLEAHAKDVTDKLNLTMQELKALGG